MTADGEGSAFYVQRAGATGVLPEGKVIVAGATVVERAAFYCNNAVAARAGRVALVATAAMASALINFVFIVFPPLI